MIYALDKFLAGGSATTQADKMPTPSVQGAAVVPLRGYVSRGRVDELRSAIAAAFSGDSKDPVLLYINSPGGEIDGVAEVANFLRARVQASGRRVITYTDGMMASAAYWIGAQASEVYASKGALVGSIGAYTVLIDESKAMEKYGIEAHLVASAEFKGRMADGKVTEEDVAYIQTMIDAVHKMFTDDVKQGRKMTDEQVKAAATGRAYFASEAAALGLVDGIKTFDEIVSMVVPPAPPKPVAVVRQPYAADWIESAKSLSSEPARDARTQDNQQ